MYFVPCRLHVSLLSARNELSVFCEGCSWMPHYTSRSQEVRFNWDWSDSEPIHWVNDPRDARLSVQPGVWSVCTLITQIAVVSWQTQTHWLFSPWRILTKIHTSVKQWTPEVTLYCFVMISWTQETSRISSSRATNGSTLISAHILLVGYLEDIYIFLLAPCQHWFKQLSARKGKMSDRTTQLLVSNKSGVWALNLVSFN